MLVLILATACQMPPQAPPLEHRVVILEAKAKTHDKMFDEVQTRLAKLEGVKSTPCPCGVANCQCGCATGGVCRCLEQVKASAKTVSGYISLIEPVYGATLVQHSLGQLTEREPTPIQVAHTTKFTMEGKPYSFAKFAGPNYLGGAPFKATIGPSGVADTFDVYPAASAPAALPASASTKDNPTYHYPPNTTYTVQGGQVITSAEPTSMCYLDEQGRTVCQNLPQQPVAQPVVQYQQPVMYYRQPMFMAQNCGPRG
jgi:hypothetical protein